MDALREALFHAEQTEDALEDMLADATVDVPLWVDMFKRRGARAVRVPVNVDWWMEHEETVFADLAMEDMPWDRIAQPFGPVLRERKRAHVLLYARHQGHPPRLGVAARMPFGPAGASLDAIVEELAEGVMKGIAHCLAGVHANTREAFDVGEDLDIFKVSDCEVWVGLTH